MIVFLWFSMVLFVILVGFVVLGVTFRHYWKEYRLKANAPKVSEYSESSPE